MDGGEHQAQAAPQGALAGDDTGLERRGRRHIERRVAAAYGRGYGPSTAEVRMRFLVPVPGRLGATAWRPSVCGSGELRRWPLSRQRYLSPGS